MKENELDLSGFDEAINESELDLSGFDESVNVSTEDDILSEIPSEVFAPANATAGALIGKGAKEALNLTGKGLDKVSDMSRSFPIVGDAVGAYKYASEGESVVGEKARKNIIKKSEELSNEVSEKLIKQKKNASKKIGKTLDLLDKKVPPKNYNKYLNKIERSINNIDTPTEEAEKTVKELKNKLKALKESKTTSKVINSGLVKSGQQDAIERLKDLQNKLTSEAEELGNRKSFGPIKVDQDAKIVKSVDIGDGRVRSMPIKASDYTPIDIETNTKEFYKKMKPSDLKKLEKGIREIKDVSKPSTQAFSATTGAYGEVKDLLNNEIGENLGDKSLDRYKNANKQYKAVLEAEDLIPSLKKGERGSIDLSDFLRKTADDSKSGDKKLQKLEALLSKVQSGNPDDVKKLEKEILKMSDKYDLSDLTRKLGLDSTSLRNMSVRGGDLVGKVAKPLKTVGKKIVKNLPIIGAGIGIAASYSEAKAAGMGTGEAISRAIENESIDTILGPAYPERVSVQPEEAIFHKIAKGEKISPEDLKKVNQFRPEVMQEATENMLASENKGIQNFGQQLQSINESEDTDITGSKLFQLQQQPAFRELMRRQNKNTEELNSKLGDFPAPDDVNYNYVMQDNSSPDTIDETPEYNTNREPASEVIDENLDFIMSEKIEGGYQNYEEDNGNFIDGVNIGTNRGITPSAYKEFFGKTPSVEDMKNLSKEDASDIYKQNYLENPKINSIEDEGLQLQTLDFGIHSGPTTAIKKLQEMVGATPDGKIGPKTLKAIDEYNGNIHEDYAAIRKEYLDKIIEKTPEKSKFEKGWDNRVDTITEKAKKIERNIDRVATQVGSGEDTPINQIDDLLGSMNELTGDEAELGQLQNKAVNIKSIADGENLKEMIRKLHSRR